MHHRQHVWEFLGVFEVLAFDCFEGALGGVVIWTDGVEGSSLLAFDVAAEVLVAHGEAGYYRFNQYNQGIMACCRIGGWDNKYTRVMPGHHR